MEIVEPMSPESVKLEIQENFICPLCLKLIRDLARKENIVVTLLKANLDTPDELAEHFRTLHMDLIDQIGNTCIICSQSFQSKTQLEAHHQKHRYIPHGLPSAKQSSPIKRKVSLGGRPCVLCQGEFKPESCLRHPYDEFIMCLLCYGRELEKHIEKVAKSGGKLTEEFEYSQLLCVDSLLSAYGEKRVRGAPNRMSKAEIDARVKAVDKDLEQNPTEDKAQLIRNYGLTQADYERYTSKTQSLSTLIDHRPKGEYKKSTPRKETLKTKNGENLTVIRPDISKLYETYNLISPSATALTNSKNNQLTVLQDGLYSSTNSTRRGRVSRPKRENTCVNCGCKNATLWRKLKSADEIQAKKPDLKVDRSKDHLAGQLACNPCALYWSMHGRHRLKEHTVDYVPLRRKSKNHSNHHSKVQKDTSQEASLPSMVNSDQLTEVLATLSESLSSLKKTTDVEVDKVLGASPKRRKLEDGAVSSDSVTSDESEIDTQVVAAYLENELLGLAGCDVCKNVPKSFDQVRTCFMCPSKFYCDDCLLSIPHLVQHSKLSNQLSQSNN